MALDEPSAMAAASSIVQLRTAELLQAGAVAPAVHCGTGPGCQDSRWLLKPASSVEPLTTLGVCLCVVAPA